LHSALLHHKSPVVRGNETENLAAK